MNNLFPLLLAVIAATLTFVAVWSYERATSVASKLTRIAAALTGGIIYTFVIWPLIEGVMSWLTLGITFGTLGVGAVAGFVIWRRIVGRQEFGGEPKIVGDAKNELRGKLDGAYGVIRWKVIGREEVRIHILREGAKNEEIYLVNPVTHRVDRKL